MTDTHRQYRRVRIAVRLIFSLGVAVSLAANVLHADPNLISQAVAAWAPLALLLAVELISHVPARRKGRSIVRILATAAVAGIAAWVSYWHMVGVAHAYGETGITPYLLPISVDGLIVVASITRVEVDHRLRDMTTTTTEVNAEPATHQTTADTHRAPAQPRAKPPAVGIPADTLSQLAATHTANKARHNGAPAQQTAQQSLF